jgi:hypothetical protein
MLRQLPLLLLLPLRFFLFVRAAYQRSCSSSASGCEMKQQQCRQQ